MPIRSGNVEPSTTRATFWSSRSVMNAPEAIDRFFTDWYDAVTPMSSELELLSRVTSCPCPLADGATSPIRSICARAAASSRVSDCTLDEEPRAPGAPPKPPAEGMTVSRLDPAAWTLLSIEAWLPAPIASMAMTEAMPTTMPSMVRPLRTLLDVSEWNVSAMRSVNLTARHLRGTAGSPRCVRLRRRR